MAADMMLYWGSGSPPCWRLMIALEEKQLQGYKHKMLSFEKGEQKCAEVMQLNPRGQLPAFKHGDVVVNESIAACMYLENVFKSQGTRLMPDDAPQKALVLQRMMEIQSLPHLLHSTIFYDHFTPEAERHESARTRNMQNLAKELKLWEGYLQKLGKGSYLAGRNFSMADVVCFPFFAFLVRFGLSKERYPMVVQYYELVKERPSVKASWPPHWLQNPQGQDTLKDL